MPIIEGHPDFAILETRLATLLLEAQREAGEEVPQPQPGGAAKPHDRQGDQAEATREAGIEVPQPPQEEPKPEPAPTQGGGDS